MDERLKKNVLDAKVVRGMYQGFDHNMVIARMRVKIKWDLGRKNDVMEDERVVASDRI